MHYPLSTLYCFSTLYLDGNHGLSGLCIWLLIQSQIQCNWGSTVLKRTSTQAVLILCGDVCHLDYARWWSYITSGACTLMATKAFLVSRWSLNNSSACNLIAGKTDLHSRSPSRVSLLTSCTYRPPYLCGFEGAIFFGDCVFRVDPSGLLTRNGSCPTKSGDLRLSGMGIKAFAPDVFSNLSSVRWRMCCVMNYVQTTRHVFCCKRREYLRGKCSVLTTLSLHTNEFSGMMDGYTMWFQVIMPQQLRNLTNTSTELACTDDVFGLYLVDLTFCVATALWIFAATSFSSCLQACSRAWHPWGLSTV